MNENTLCILTLIPSSVPEDMENYIFRLQPLKCFAYLYFPRRTLLAIACLLAAKWSFNRCYVDISDSRSEKILRYE